MDRRIPEASIHGRFQIFHREHLDYAQRAFDRADFVWIGLTNSLQTTRSSVSPSERLAWLANPLTYYERVRCVRISLSEAGIAPHRFDFVPCPIEQPEYLEAYFPRECPAYITLVEAWSLKKVEVLRSHGYRVEVLHDREAKGISGTSLRRMIEAGDEAWKGFVLPGAAAYLESLDLRRRLAELRSVSTAR